MDNRITRTVITLLSLLALALVFSCEGDETGADGGGTLIERSETQAEPLPGETSDSLKTDGEEEEAAKPKDKEPSLEKFEYSWTDSKDLPDILIVVDDFGNSTALLEDFAQLPPEVAFAVLPDLSATQVSGQVASQNGHEVLIHVPMEALGGGNPGKRYISTDSSPEQVAELLTAFKAQLPMAIGANNHMGSAVTANEELMKTVYNELHARGMFFLDSYTGGSKVPANVAKTLGYPPLKRDMFLDVPDLKEHKKNSDESLAYKISSLGKYKGRREPIVIITHCHDREKLAALRKFITQIQGMGLRLTTLSRARNIAA
ncbi:MAG: divergent polysaccharide deacetylase family protein [Candidatus Cloacimonetes bacterium]|nr:divergent polysaccharide deacetylase family protein [Candidatus Cloacimonadota bacterium]